MFKLFDEIKKEDRVGGKAQSLGILRKNKLPVPNGFVITSDSLLKLEDDNLRTEVVSKIKSCIKLISSGKDSRFAVRSSAVAEDSAENSFAGGFDSLLNIDESNIIESIGKVYSSRLNHRVKTYSQNRGISEEHTMCVIVQEMVQADYSGVLFSADPVTGSYANFIGNFVAGLGEDLVSGEKNPEIFSIERASGRYGGIAKLKKVSRKLWNYIHKIEKIYSLPMDLEWAVKGNRVYILQARPITNLSNINREVGIQNDSFTGNFLWTNANVAEAVPDIMTPGTWSLLRIFHEMGPLDLPKIVPSAANIAGRPYVNMSYMVSLYKALGKEYKETGNGEFFGEIPKDMEIPVIPLRKRDILPPIVKALFTTIPKYIRSAKDIPSFIGSTKDKIREFKTRIERVDKTSELADLWCYDFKDYYEWTCRYLRIATIPLGDRVSKLRVKLNRYISDNYTNDILSNLSGETSSMVSLNLIRGMAKINRGELSKEEYIEESGMRGPHEFELSMPDMQEDHSLIDNYLETLGGSDPEENLKRQKEKSSAAWSILKEKTGKYKKFYDEFHKIADLAAQRELVRAEMIRVYRSMRYFYLKAGELTELQEDVFLLEISELIDLLRGDEIDLNTIEKRKRGYKLYSDMPQYPGLIKGKFNPEEWLKDPNKNIIMYDECGSGNSGNSVKKSEVRGHGASSGVVTGRVRILNKPEDGIRLKNGEILVAVTTNIGWTPLFTKAAGVITDVGAPLSHAAIVARELGIPAIVGCGNGTTILKNGDLVTVNGTQGTVVKESGEEE